MTTTNQPCVDIQLYLKDGAWVAKYHGAGRAEVERLFGTDILPTAKTAPATVLSRIQALNPGLVVEAI